MTISSGRLVIRIDSLAKQPRALRKRNYLVLLAYLAALRDREGCADIDFMPITAVYLPRFYLNKLFNVFLYISVNLSRSSIFTFSLIL